MTTLTDLAIRKLQPPTTGRKIIWDNGLGVRISHTGRKAFVVKHNGVLRTVGEYPAMSLKSARTAQLETKLTDTPQRRLERTEDAILAFLEDCERRVRPSTVDGYRYRLKDLTSSHLSDITAHSIPNTPQHITAVKAFLNWCVRMQYIERHAFQYTKAQFRSRTRVLSSDEIKAIWSYDYPPYSDYLKVLLLTGQRRGQWSNYSIVDDTLIFPAESMKNGHEHAIPLTSTVGALLPLPYFNGWSKAKQRIDKHVTIPPWTVHDIRRTFSTICASLGIPLHVTEQILAHRSGTISGVAAVYNRHSYLKEMRQALEKYEQHLHTLLT